MNRSVLAVALVCLLVVQGSVAGLFASASNTSAAAENTTTGSPPDESSEHSNATSTATDDALLNGSGSSDRGSTAANGSTPSAANGTAEGDESTATPSTPEPATATSTPEESPATATTEQDGERSERTESPTTTDSAPQANGSPTATTTRSPSAVPDGARGTSGVSAGTETEASPTASAPSTQNVASGRERTPSGATPPATASAGAPAGAARSAPTGAAGGATSGSTDTTSDAEFSVVSVASDVPVGGTGNITVTIENTGEDATDAVVNLQSMSGELLFGQSPNTSRFVGEWDEGENKTIEVRARAARTADTTEYPMRATVSYEDDDGNSSQSAPLTFGVAPDDEQQFTLGGVDADLQVGESGTISGTITNEGPKTATDAVVAFAPNGSRAVVPRQSQYVLGSLDPDESASFELPVAVNSTAEPGERQVPFVVQYYDAEGNPMRSETLTARVDIGEETDDFEIINVDSAVESGEDGTLSVTMENTGEDVTDATISVQSLSSGILFGQSANASQYIEDWDTGDRRTVTFDVTAAAGTADGSYPMQASVSYTDSDGDQGRSGPFTFGVAPDEGRDDYEVVSSSTDVQVGDTGTVSVTLENTGANASEATVSLRSLSGDITFGRTANATQFVGEWPVGAQRTVTMNATASNRTDLRSYPFQASVAYDDPDGDRSRAGPFTVGVTPQPEQAFDITNTTSSLRVGSEGNVTARVTNRGPQNASNAVVRLVTQNQNTNPQESEAAIGRLPAGESANVSFPVEITDSAEAGQRQFSFVVEYDNQNGDTRRSERLDTQVAVAPQRDSFVVTRANTSVGVGSSGAVTLNVTNNRDSEVRNVNAKAFVDDPLSLASSEAYIAQLAPGETKQVSFDVSASGSANEGQYPLSVDFEYETASGDSQLSQTYEVPVSVAATDGGGLFSPLGFTAGLAAVLVVFGVGWVWSRR